MGFPFTAWREKEAWPQNWGSAPNGLAPTNEQAEKSTASALQLTRVVQLGRNVGHPFTELGIEPIRFRHGHALSSAGYGLLDRELPGEGAECLEGAPLAVSEHRGLVRLGIWPRLSRGDDLHRHATVNEKNCPIKDACDRRLEHLLVQPVPEVVGGRLYRHQSQYFFDAGRQVAADDRFSFRPLHLRPV
jgi:hypothetical protein